MSIVGFGFSDISEHDTTHATRNFLLRDRELAMSTNSKVYDQINLLFLRSNSSKEIICLEEYVNMDKVGTLKACDHDFHNSHQLNQKALLQDVCEKEEAIEKGSSTPPNERPTRLNLVKTRNRSHSSSPATDKRYSRTDRYLKDSGSRVLEKTMSLGELKLEEVKGFMDVGFIFRKEHIRKRMISVVPGLQRLEVVLSEGEEKICEDSEAISINGIVSEEGEEDDKREIARPYLSEAWLIKRPDSPLLSLRIPKVSAATDMKKHLRYWAKTVATVVLQES
ncbi:hypothetical protein K7X08_037656 [Anisodus acutangulus]|uniref:Uncharacterized protein n=1 Tax=Anisodus acutangulus TaxID=402998 RepID=A0A9Q1MWX3_9SOLA|nr:hypothetical protein K7X08_037656 [Anisodus acutangulus]